MILEAICVGTMQVNCYVLASEEGSRAILIDPGDEERKIWRVLNRHRLRPSFIINTHGHIDHIGADDHFGVPVYIHRQDLALLKDPQMNLSHFFSAPYSVKAEIKTLEDKESVILEQVQLEVVHTPGHTPGGICLLMKKPRGRILFTGDSLFSQGIGRTDFPGASQRALIASIKEKLLSLSDDTVVYPGHGASSTIGKEKKSNPFLI